MAIEMTNIPSIGEGFKTTAYYDPIADNTSSGLSYINTSQYFDISQHLKNEVNNLRLSEQELRSRINILEMELDSLRGLVRILEPLALREKKLQETMDFINGEEI